MEQKEKNSLFFIWLTIILGWFMDVITSILGLQLGAQEILPFFWVFPAMWLILLMSLSTFAFLFPWAHSDMRIRLLRKGIIIGAMWGSFIPALRNSILIIMVSS